MTPTVYHNQPMAEYLAMPALSASILQAMVERCPAAAWFESWLNPRRVLDFSAQTDAGKIAHAILLEGSESGVEIIEPADHPAEKTGNIPDGWTNKSIRAARDNARAAGKIPVLSSQMAEIRAMVDAARIYVSGIAKTEKALYGAFMPAGGDSELTLVWKEGDTLCRMRPDRISTDRKLIVNYKTTATSVEPDRWGRGPFLEYLMGAAWYVRGVRQLFDVEASYVYLCQETAPPYLCSLVGVDPAAMELGASKVDVALERWQRCVERNDWPGYPARVAYPELPPWVLAAWEAQQMMEPFA